MTTNAFAAPTAECDLIMQGGITSGIVYPPAILKIAPTYRFRSIGGTSAGAIAAAATAAAEYGRTRGGFERLAQVPQELAAGLLSLFQPSRPFKGAFAIFITLLGNRHSALKGLAALAFLISRFPLSALLGAAPALIYVYRTHGPDRTWLEWTAIAAALLVGLVCAWLTRFLSLAFYSLPRQCFGVCSGMRTAGNAKPALTEWIADLLDDLAQLQSIPDRQPGAPLTFGDLEGANIQLRMMTTNVSLRRPYSLPFVTAGNPEHEGRYAFCEKEWAAYFPTRIMDWLRSCTRPVSNHAGYRYLPETELLPVVVAVRLSLSFPLLLRAVPLWRPDWTYQSAAERSELRRCVFSDGGLSSNFPIHFFDSFLPTRPTFAIGLEQYDPKRYASDSAPDRVYMPAQADTGFLLPIDPVESLGSFAGALFDSARLWQDNLQRILAGYRERVAHIALKADEGGLNLNMDPKVIHKLNTLGTLAGDCILQFNMPEHQWRRFLVVYARLEEAFEQMNRAYAAEFETFLDTYPPHTESYKPSTVWLAEARSRLAAVLQLTQPWSATPLRTSGRIPKPDTDLRITPRP